MPTTASTIDTIEAQGAMGRLTTLNVGQVATRTVDHALRGKAIYVPGFLNQTLRRLGSLLPAAALSRLLGRRWRAAHRERMALAAEIDLGGQPRWQATTPNAMP
jgi:hypothetical protein